MADKKNITKELHADSYDEKNEVNNELNDQKKAPVEDESNYNDSREKRMDRDNEEELDSGAPEVVQSGKKSKALIIIIVLVAAYFLFNIITSSNKSTRIEEAKKEREETIFSENKKVEAIVAEVPIEEEEEFIIPPKPPEEIAISPPSSLILDPIPTYDEPIETTNNESSTSLGERVRSNMVLFSGGGSSGGLGGLFGEGGADEALPNVFLSTTSSANVTVTRTYKLTNTILQGKMIDAVLETAINTELNGLLRAVVSRDVYSEKGRNILIPRGSRLIGSYSTEISSGQARVNMVWTRLIRPDGLDAAIGSPATDTMGRSGVLGGVDRKYLPTIANAFLSTTLTVGLAAAVEAATDGIGIQQTENTSGSINTAGDITDIAALSGINSFSEILRSIITQNLSVTPTINVEQGTRLKVFINKDVIFPDSVINSVSYVN